MKRVSILSSAVVALTGALACELASSPASFDPYATGVWLATPDQLDAGSRCDRSTTPTGSEIWRRSFPEGDVQDLTSVAIDPASGAVFVARAAGETFKIERSGTILWNVPLGSLVAADGRGNAYVAGMFSGTVQIGAQSRTSAGGTDVYVALLDSNGGVSSSVALGGPADDRVVGLAVDADGHAVVSGSGLGTVKISPDGRRIWQRDFSGHLAVDSADCILLTGALTGTMTFGATTLISRGGDDVFVAKLDADGNTLFARGFGDSGIVQRGEAIAVTLTDDIVVSGVIDGSVDFGGGALGVAPGTCPSEVWCEQAGFVVQLDSSGHHRWSRALAPVRSLVGIASDPRGNVLVSGASPGDAPPYHLPLLLAFDAAGNEIPSLLGPDTGLLAAGAGHGVAFDSCGNLLWALSMPPLTGANTRPVLVKLAP